MSSFKDRIRMTLEEAIEIATSPTNVITHVLKNEDDGTYSVMSHIVCEWCDYCDEQGDCRCQENIVPAVAKEDPYENQN